MHNAPMNSHAFPYSEQGPTPKNTGENSLLQALGRPEAIALVVGNVIGSGIFFKPAIIAQTISSVPVILFIWVTGGLLCLFGALSIAELAAMLPRSGGLYVYLREAYGRLTAFLFGWTEFWIVRPASIGALATAFTLPLPLPDAIRFTLSVGVVLLLAWVNLAGVIWGGKLQDLTTLIKAVFLAGIALLPFIFNQVSLSHLTIHNTSSNTGLTLSGFATALLAVLWAYNGWHQVTPVAEEIKNPQKNIPWALITGMGILILLYVSANVAYHGVFSLEDLALQKNVASSMIDRIIGPVGGAVMTGLVMCSVFGAINGTMLYGPRVFFAMARDRLFFSSLGKIHKTRRTPGYAIASQAILAIILMTATGFIPIRTIQEELPEDLTDLVFPDSYSGRINIEIKSSESNQDRTPFLVFRGTPMGYREKQELAALSDHMTFQRALETIYQSSKSHVFDLLTDLVIFGASIFYVLTVAAVLILRRSHPHLERPYQTWGYPWVPLTFVVVYIWFLGTLLVDNPLESGIGIALIATGFPAYYFWQRRPHHTDPPVVNSS